MKDHSGKKGPSTVSHF